MNTALRTPRVVTVIAVVALAFLALPALAVLIRTPWSSFLHTLSSPEVAQAIWLSLRTSAATVILALIFGIPTAVLLSRLTGARAGWSRALVVLPLVLPPTVAGVALLAAYGGNGVLTAPFGIQLSFTTIAVILAQLFVAMPFLIITVEGALRGHGNQLAEAAAVLGASPKAILWRVTLRQIRPAIVAGSILCWARALGEFGATITFAGSFPGISQTLPTEVYLLLQTQPELAYSVSVVFILVSLTVVIALRRSWVGAVRDHA